MKKMSLALKTFIGFGLGILIGLIFQEKATVLKPLGTIFLNMIKMIVVPLVFCSITAGVASLGDLRKLRSIGVKVVGLYALTSAIQSFSDVMSKIFGPLGKLILTVYASDVILVFLMYVPMVALLARFPVVQFFKGIWKVWVVTLSTTSSAGSLPITTSVTNDDFGVSPELSSFSLPLEIVGMIAGIFRLIDMANTTFNVTGDVVTTMVVARSENMLQPPVPAGKN